MGVGLVGSVLVWGGVGGGISGVGMVRLGAVLREGYCIGGTSQFGTTNDSALVPMR